MDPAPIASAPTLWEWLRELVSDVLPVVIGGALAIGGSVATMWMQRRASTNDFKKKKIEELVSLSDELQISLGEITRYAFDASEKHPEGVSPWQKMHVICKLYFR